MPVIDAHTHADILVSLYDRERVRQAALAQRKAAITRIALHNPRLADALTLADARVARCQAIAAAIRRQHGGPRP